MWIRNSAYAQAQVEAIAKTQMAHLRKVRDEVNEVTFYYSRAVPMTHVGTYFGLYIGVPDNGSPYLRWKFMYAGSDWLFIDSLTFNIDGHRIGPIQIPYGAMERDNSAGEVWEWHDEEIASTDNLVPLLALSEGKKVIVRFEGRQYYKDHILTDTEKKAMLQILNVYAYLSDHNPAKQPSD